MRDVGTFRFAVDLFIPTSSKDASGQVIHSFIRSQTLMCHVKDVREKLTDDGVQEMSGKRTTQFTMRYTSDLNIGCRLQYRGSMYSIERIDRTDQRNRFLIVYGFEVDQ